MKFFASLLSAGLILLAGSKAGARDLDHFARLPAVWSAEISPDGNWLATGCRSADRMALCAYDLVNGGNPITYVPPEDMRLNGFYFVSPDHLILTLDFFHTLSTNSGLRDIRVDRAFVFRLSTREGTVLMRNIENITDNSNVVSRYDAEPDKVLTGITMRTGGESRAGALVPTRAEFVNVIYEVDLNSGRARVHDRERVLGRVMSTAGEDIANYDRDPETQRFTIENARTGRQLYSEVHGASEPDVIGLADEGGLVVRFPEGPRRGMNRLDLETGELSWFEAAGPNLILRAVFDSRTEHLVAFEGTRDDLPVQIFIDESLAGDAAALAQALGVQRVLLESWSHDRNMIVFQTVQPGQPRQYFLYDRSGGRVSLVSETYPELTADAGALGEVRMISYQASDGLEIPAVLTLPARAGEADGPFPLIVLPHGGPQVRDDLSFDWLAQAYANMGYLVLQPNYRGSGGYGQDFIQAGYGEFGGRMIEDILDGARHLQQAGLARQGGYCLAGASYGGYAALMGAIRAPGEVACVISMHPVTSPVALIGRAMTADDEVITQYWERYIGPRYMDGNAAGAISPYARAGELTAPTVILHGAEDRTVPLEQGEAMARALRDAPHFTFVVLEGDDHYFNLASSRRRVLEESQRLLNAHLPVE